MANRIANKQALDEFSRLSNDDRIEKVKSGEIAPPKLGTDLRREFDEIMGFGGGQPKQPQPQQVIEDSPATPPTPPEKKEDAKPEPKPETPVSPPPQPSQAVTDFGGYKSMEELLESNKKMQETISELVMVNKKIRDGDSRVGRENKALRERAETLQAELAKLKGASQEGVIEDLPDAPDPSNNEKYPGGYLDEQYQADRASYDKKVVAYNRQLRNAFSEQQRKLKELEERPPQQLQQPDDSWGSFTKSVGSFQTKFGLSTTVPWEVINQTLLIAQNSVDPSEKAAAQRAWDALPQRDRDNWQRTTKAVNAWGEWKDGSFQTNYRTIEAALVDNGVFDQYNTITPPKPPAPAEVIKAESVKLQQDQGVSALSADQIQDSSKRGLGDPNMAKVKRLEELNDMRRSDPQAFRRNKALSEEYTMLRQSFGVPVPGK